MELLIRQRGERWYIETRQFGTMFSRTGYATREEAERVIQQMRPSKEATK